MAYRLLSNWLPTGTCWAEMALRSAWMFAWLIVGLKTQTFGPKVVVSASGHRDVPRSAFRVAAAVVALAVDAGAALAETAATPVAVARPTVAASTASSRAGRLRRKALRSGVLCIEDSCLFVDPRCIFVPPLTPTVNVAVTLLIQHK